MGVNSGLARAYGSDLDTIWIGPITATLPTDLDADPVGFTEVGWLSDEGITEANTGSKTEFRGHQGNGVVRTRMDSGGKTFAFEAIEDKPEVRELWDNILDSDETPDGNVVETVSPNQRVSARKAIIDVFDADEVTLKQRILIPRLEIIPNGDLVYTSSGLTVRALIGQVIGNFQRIYGESEV